MWSWEPVALGQRLMFSFCSGKERSGLGFCRDCLQGREQGLGDSVLSRLSQTQMLLGYSHHSRGPGARPRFPFRRVSRWLFLSPTGTRRLSSIC